MSVKDRAHQGYDPLREWQIRINIVTIGGIGANTCCHVRSTYSVFLDVIQQSECRRQSMKIHEQLLLLQFD
jgi:hypothetical protein